MMMGLMRLRRFRTPIILAIFIVLALYQFTSLKESSTFSVETLKSYSAHIPIPAHDAKPLVQEPLIREPTSAIPLPSISPIAKPKGRPPPPPGKQLADDPSPKTTAKIEVHLHYTTPAVATKDAAAETLVPEIPVRSSQRPGAQPIGTGTDSPQKVIPAKSPEHWKKDPVYYPIPSKSLIPLPTGKPIAIPQIQASFAPETESDKSVRIKRQAAVKKAFLHSWQIYKEEAWGHDELIPVSGGFRDKFGGWGASLVDALDTLWMMGEVEEFEEAVEAVGLIDFTTTTLNEIPVFETTIRYIGGLIAAHDLTDGKYPVLLEKAIELGDMIYGAFDTPNHMPQLYYRWKGRQRSKDSKSGSRVVMAELTSLSLEFTRLSQLTGNDTYYDAIARITNAVEKYQFNTSSPGLWPMYADARGCTTDKKRKPKKRPTQVKESLLSQSKNKDSNQKEVFTDSTQKVESGESGITEKPIPIADVVGGTGREVFTKDSPVMIQDETIQMPGAQIPESQAPEPQTFGSELPGIPGAPNSDVQDAENPKSFTKGITEQPIPIADVVGGTGREVFPDTEERPVRPNKIEHAHEKRWSGRDSPTHRTASVDGETLSVCDAELLMPVGTHVEKYGLGALIDSLYEYLIKEYLLLGGVPEADQYRRQYESSMDLVKEKLLFRPMVEGNPDVLLSGVLEVDSREEKLDPISSHLACFAGGMLAMGGQVLDRSDDLNVGSKLTDGCVWAYGAMKTGIMPEVFRVNKCNDTTDCEYSEEEWVKSLAPTEEWVEMHNKYKEPMGATLETPLRGSSKAPLVVDDALPPAPRPVHDPHHKRSPPGTPLDNKPFMNAEDYAREIIKDKKLPPGFKDLNDKKYILRPEAIESVWYMYRITADKKWQDKGWKMFEAVEKATLSPLAHSAIKDITLEQGDEGFEFRDEMESFWFGETLKYFYLLFSEPDLVSLDDYVLNTEAHPFKRPKPQKE
ncbi:glycosyl hydrolase family 47-domain-containing protein [Geopyxis carbonaria]|nr:glycosyl hydrolase family 47-domain-containing protein [Geopyxis carbonaria]